MIGYIEGKIIKNDQDGLLLLNNGIGYEILLPEITFVSFQKHQIGEAVSLFIYYHRTERQPVPILIGFENEMDKIFFKRFISVEDIGVIKAVKALTISVETIITAIENEDMKTLTSLKGIGKRTAAKIIATLKGKFDDFKIEFDSGPENSKTVNVKDDYSSSVVDVLTFQLGYHRKEAEKLVREAVSRKPDMITPEEVLEEVYRGRS